MKSSIIINSTKFLNTPTNAAKYELLRLLNPQTTNQIECSKDSVHWNQVLRKTTPILNSAFTAVGLNEYIKRFPEIPFDAELYRLILRRLAGGSDPELASTLVPSIALQWHYLATHQKDTNGFCKPSSEDWSLILELFTKYPDFESAQELLETYMKSERKMSLHVFRLLARYYLSLPDLSSPSKLLDLMLAADSSLLTDESTNEMLDKLLSSHQSLDPSKFLVLLSRLPAAFAKEQGYSSQLTFLLTKGVSGISFAHFGQIYPSWSRIVRGLDKAKGTRARAISNCFESILFYLKQLDDSTNTLAQFKAAAAVVAVKVWQEFYEFACAHSRTVPAAATETLLKLVEQNLNVCISQDTLDDLNTALFKCFSDTHLEPSGRAPVIEWSLPIFFQLCALQLRSGSTTDLLRWFNYMLAAMGESKTPPTRQFVERLESVAHLYGKNSQLEALLDYVEEVRVDLLPLSVIEQEF